MIDQAQLEALYPTMYPRPAAPAAAPTSAPSSDPTAEALTRRYPSMAPTPADTARAAARAAAEAADAAALRPRYPRMAEPARQTAAAGDGAPPTETDALAASYSRMRADDAVRQAIEPGLVRAAAVLGLDDAGTGRIRDATLELARDLGATATAIGELVDLYARYAGGEADDATVAAWEREAMARARVRFGDSLETRLARARAYIQARPVLATELLETGLGSHPRWVLALLEAADRLPGGGR